MIFFRTETPSFVKPMEDKETKVSETTVLECMASGSPKPELRWQKDGEEIGPTERRFFTAGNQLLIIVETREEDAGTYTCEMTNTLGAHKDSAILSVIPGMSRPFWRIQFAFSDSCVPWIQFQFYIDSNVILLQPILYPVASKIRAWLPASSSLRSCAASWARP